MTQSRNEEYLRKSIQKAMGAVGRSTVISAEIPVPDLLAEMLQRAVEVFRGLVRLRAPVFIGSRVKLRGKRHLNLSRGVSIGSNSVIDARGRRGLVMGPRSRLGRFGIITTTSHLSLYGVGVSIGDGSGIGDFFHIGASGGVTIGKDVIVGPYLTVHSQDHIFSDPDVPIRKQGTKQHEVVVADDCWIGSRVTLLAGTRIGPGTVIASGSVVKGEHPGREVLAGVPARSIASRP